MGMEGQESKRRRRRFFSSRRRADDADASTSPEDGDEDAPDAPVSDAPEELPVAAPASVEPSGPMSGTFNPRVEPTAPVSEEAPSEEEARTESLGESSSLPGGRPAASSPAQGVAEPSSGQDREPDASAPPSPTPPEPLRARAPETAPRAGPTAVADSAGEKATKPQPPLQLPAILAIANQKGGVGKTTTAVNLGAALAELGLRVLVVDLDPQGNATTGLGVNARDLQQSIYDVVMNDLAVEDCVEPTSVKNLFVAPATIDLAGAEIELVPAFSRELKLRRALEEVRDEYDLTLIDCPPSLGLLTVNALAAADGIIVPIQCEYYALEGLGQLLRNVALVRSNLNATLDVHGIVLTMYDARTKLAGQVEQEVRAHFGPTVYRQTIPRNVRIGEAPSYGKPITVYDPMSRGAIAYRELAREVSSGFTRRTG